VHQRLIVDTLVIVRILPVGRRGRGFDPDSVETLSEADWDALFQRARAGFLLFSGPRWARAMPPAHRRQCGA